MVLGGVVIARNKGPAGHSDGDAVVHALIDALLGAAALRDIGFHFPDTDPAYKGASSISLLKKVHALLKNHSWQLVNADVVIHLQAPRLMPYIPQMQQKLAEALETTQDCISIKAKTGEKIGLIGEERAIEVYAVCLLERF
ncbi:MAG TPA: 2-C-methyl-D-erythritol 2,4-cyclodiphosphate synthase [Bacteroidales bacterium]|nr:2-C-methyl-D-erythritol 2,4-cyclodiphosphate synthase [Bacteroidales bacterium]